MRRARGMVCQDIFVGVCCVSTLVALVMSYQLIYSPHPQRPGPIKSKETTAVIFECETNFTTAEGTIIIPELSILETLNRQTLACLYHRYITNPQYLCARSERLGRMGDGGWDICVGRNYRLQKSCLVYSAGINFDFTFDDAVAAKYGCEVHSFDPSMDVKDHIHRPRVFFHDIGLAEANENRANGWRMRTLQGIRKQLGHMQRRIDILKMDIEHSEWEAIPDIVASGSYQDISQLLVEFHSWTIISGRYVRESSRKEYLTKLKVLKLIYDAGFRIFSTGKNLHCQFQSEYGPMRTSCHEVCMVKT